MVHGAKIVELGKQVELAIEEITSAIGLHESWKPMVYDQALIDRMGTSYATGTFGVIRWALRREMLLALMRIWDDDSKAISVRRIVSILRQPGLLEALAIKLAGDGTGAFHHLLVEHLKSNYDERVERIGLLYDKYNPGGIASDVMTRLKVLRNTTFAHRQEAPQNANQRSPNDDEIEAFYLDTRTIVEDLMHVVRSTALDTNDTAQAFGHFARFFWEGVCGERTPGHPSYRESI